MTPKDIGAMMDAAHAALGAQPEFALILLGEACAYPHGSGKPQAVRDGEVVLMDCGCCVEGYQSDISRTFVFGEATAEQRKVWQQMREGQQIAIETARVGVPAGSVDDAVRAQYVKWGYGPGYKLPGLSHRTGHGIGLDGHEPVNLVHGEATPLAPGMCFCDEPGIYLPGKFGIRLEDCFHMGAEKPIWFSTPRDRSTSRSDSHHGRRRFGGVKSARVSAEHVLGAAVRALRPAGLLRSADRPAGASSRDTSPASGTRAADRWRPLCIRSARWAGSVVWWLAWARIIRASRAVHHVAHRRVPDGGHRRAVSANSSAGTTASACSSDRWCARSRYFR